MGRLKLFSLLLSGTLLASNPAIGQDTILSSSSKAKAAANCAATMFSTGKLKISYNQQSDSEAEGMLKVGMLLLYLSALYSSQDEALAIYDEKNKSIDRGIIKASNGGASRSGIASYILNNLVPQNERCLNTIKDIGAKMSYLNDYAITPEGIELGNAVRGKTLDPIINSAHRNNSLPLKMNENSPVSSSSAAKINEIQNLDYIKPIKFSITELDLKGQARNIRLRVLVNELGRVDDVTIIDSTGLPDLDSKIRSAMRKATFIPYKEKGVALPAYFKQSFILNLSEN